MTEHRTRTITDVLIDDGIAPSIAKQMSREQYGGHRRMNASTLVEGLVDAKEIDPTAIRDTYEGHRPPVKQALQDSFDRGTLAHWILLEPEKIAGAIAVWEGGRRAGHVWDEFEAANEGKLIMKRADVVDVQDACPAFKSINAVRSVLSQQ